MDNHVLDVRNFSFCGNGWDATVILSKPVQGKFGPTICLGVGIYFDEYGPNEKGEYDFGNPGHWRVWFANEYSRPEREYCKIETDAAMVSFPTEEPTPRTNVRLLYSQFYRETTKYLKSLGSV